MTDEYMSAKDERAFEAAFAKSKFATVPRAMRTFEPRKPLTPWYHDPESGARIRP